MNNSAVEELRKKREEWRKCLADKDPNSILHQMLRMIDEAIAFRIIIEARKHTSKNKNGEPKLNILIHRLIDKGFLCVQATAIRRLIDHSPLEGKKGVFSLYSLLEDIKKHIRLFTRENIFAAEGLEYDVEAVKSKFYEYARKQPGGRVLNPPSCFDWYKLEERHKIIDQLSNVSKENRKPNDTVHKEYLEHLQNYLKEHCQKFIEIVNKYIAHAATPVSRKEIIYKDKKDKDIDNVDLGNLWEAQKAICKVARFIDHYLLYLDSLPSILVPTYTFDYLEHIDKPLIETDKVQCLDNVKKDYADEEREWCWKNIEEFKDETSYSKGDSRSEEKK